MKKSSGKNDGIQATVADPLKNPAFKAPGLGEKLREIFLGAIRTLDCVQIEVTSCCPGKCVYCPHTSQAETWKSRHMTAETFASLWPILKNSRRAHLQGWGEPLLHPRFFDFVAFALKAGCLVSTTSCGLAMNEEIAIKLAQSGMDMIAFSLAGTDAISNSARSNVPFELVCDSIAMLHKARDHFHSSLEIHLAYIMLADRMEAAVKLPDLMAELDIPVAIVSTLDYLAAPAHAALAIQPSDGEKIKIAREILEEAAECAAADERLVHFALPGPEPVAHEGGCRENIARSLYIDADGNVSPCVYLNVPGNDPAEKRLTFGNVCAQDPMKIWHSLDFHDFRQNLMKNEPATVCQNCPKRLEAYVERTLGD